MALYKSTFTYLLTYLPTVIECDSQPEEIYSTQHYCR